ncbi:DNA-nicking endonuclease, Smr domain [Pseudidiomarina planktonica]|uniref:DNA-nicking endonuclease, Smr domain n=1 Tax=Pseudidiomarina planktonica TaxID=1323738 RepID=A0A1Y6EMV5_9GAMM|nr:DNA endonuclease SmrA [Pseudidiomarina planktonica]RUO65910.1 DNA endonuclease SmrA [Pseudidiomarina planktonica]SMQ61872.1 DNA-nicking endonuclease, Smr domain [Pseudidiomarina planktonica]
MSRQDDEFELFRQEMVDVTPLVGEEVADIKKAFEPTLAQRERRLAAERQLEEDTNFLSTEYVDLVDPDDILEFRREGVQTGVYKRLKQGRYNMDASLNLHQHTLREARMALYNFIKDCHEVGIRTVLIIHGMGKQGKPHPALIKSYVNKWLRELQPVLAFHSAQRPHGGRGAMYVMLRKNAEQKQFNRELHAKK